ncbi:Hypothetical protein KVN_LOCUS113 [uncultured virus]|nr:Hypothetical protein KVN_LOCUS113 [uncultured virus]
MHEISYINHEKEQNKEEYDYVIRTFNDDNQSISESIQVVDDGEHTCIKISKNFLKSNQHMNEEHININIPEAEEDKFINYMKKVLKFLKKKHKLHHNNHANFSTCLKLK